MKDNSNNNLELLFNPKWLISGIALILLGFVLMIGTSNQDINEFAYEIFSFRRLSLAPLVVIIGYSVVGLSLFRK